MTMTGTGSGQSVTGFIANPDNPFDPVREGYPATNPTVGPDWAAKDEGFAGIIYATPTGGPANSLKLYCIDINTSTWGGIGYGLGTWDAAGVPNVGYVARLLNDYYPNTDEPASLTDLNQKAAAVQAAIWFFSDRYVLNTNMGSLRDEVVAIVDNVIRQGPLDQPPPPSLTLTPTSASTPARVLGPFTLTTDAPPATVTATGGTMYSNRAGTTLLGDGTTAEVHSGQQIWLRSAGGSSTATLQAVASATVPSGNVYLYDGNTAGVNDAQRLILAEKATLKSTVTATAEFLPFGSLVVKKTIAGPAAGSQGPVVIHVDCDDGVTRPDFVIAAGTHAGTRSRTYRRIAAGTTCEVIETSNGSTTTTTVVVRGDGQNATITEGATKTVKITDIYRPVAGRPGSLLVTKTIAGPSAGHQGPVTIHVVCDGVALSPDFVIAANTPAGSVSHTFEDIPAGSVCTVTETTDGSTGTVIVTVSGDGQSVTIPAGMGAAVSLMDVYDEGSPGEGEDIEPESPVVDATGFLTVIKDITGPAARRHGPIAILVACGGPLEDFAFDIPAGTGPGSVTRHFDNIPAGLRCAVTETATGGTSTVSAVAIGGHQTVTIPATGSATVHLTDRFTVRPPRPPTPTVTG